MELLGFSFLVFLIVAAGLVALVYALDPLTKVLRGVGMSFRYVLVRAFMSGLFAVITFIAVAFFLNGGP